jgi:hypothetical protein
LKTVRYAWTDVEKVELSSSKGLAFSTLHLRSGGSLGKDIPFYASRRKIDIYLKEQPQNFDYFKNLT